MKDCFQAINGCGKWYRGSGKYPKVTILEMRGDQKYLIVEDPKLGIEIQIYEPETIVQFESEKNMWRCPKKQRASIKNYLIRFIGDVLKTKIAENEKTFLEHCQTLLLEKKW